MEDGSPEKTDNSLAHLNAMFPLPENYKVVSYLGHGRFGQVIKCFKEDTKETVAVKIQQCSSCCYNELKLLQYLTLHHLDEHNIIKFVGVFMTEDGRVAMAFEMLDMSLLDYFLERNMAPLDICHVRSVVQQMATALNALKNNGLIHSDIKLDNIMLVDRQAKPISVKMIDFGLAFQAHKGRVGARLQPQSYRAPEIFLGLPYTEAIDMWSLGIITLVLLLGDMILAADNPYSIMKKVVDILGLPPDHLLNDGLYSRSFFEKTTSGRWRFKTPQEYWGDQPQPEEANEDAAMYKLSSLDELETLSVPHLDMMGADERKECIDLLKAMLRLDAKERITPIEVLNHPFITRGSVQHSSDNESLEPSTSHTADTRTDKTQEPGADETQEPGPDETQEPGADDTQEPGANETQEPGADDTQEPGADDTQEPGADETQEPGADETQEPGADDTQEPGANDTQEPGADETQEPGAGETQEPGADETQEPGADDTREPGANDTQEPGANETQEPGADMTQEPGAGDTQKPGADDIQEPEADKTQEPGASDTHEPGADETTELGTTQTEEPKESKTDVCSNGRRDSTSTSYQLVILVLPAPLDRCRELDEDDKLQSETCSNGSRGDTSTAPSPHLIFVKPAPPDCCYELDEDDEPESETCTTDKLEEPPENCPAEGPREDLPEDCNLELTATTPDDKEPDKKKRKKKKKNCFKRFFGWMKKTFCCCVNANDD